MVDPHAHVGRVFTTEVARVAGDNNVTEHFSCVPVKESTDPRRCVKAIAGFTGLIIVPADEFRASTGIVVASGIPACSLDCITTIASVGTRQYGLSIPLDRTDVAFRLDYDQLGLVSRNGSSDTNLAVGGDLHVQLETVVVSAWLVGEKIQIVGVTSRIKGSNLGVRYINWTAGRCGGIEIDRCRGAALSGWICQRNHRP